MIYIDWLQDTGFIPRGRKHAIRSCHMYSDNSIVELKSFAMNLGLNQKWIHNKKGKVPHFDLTPGMREKARLNGAIKLTRDNIHEKYEQCKKLFNKKLKIS